MLYQIAVSECVHENYFVTLAEENYDKKLVKLIQRTAEKFFSTQLRK